MRYTPSMRKKHKMPWFARRVPRLPIYTALSPADIERMSRRPSAASAKKPRARTLTPAQILQRIQPRAKETDEVEAFARWFSALHAVSVHAVYCSYLRRARGWFVGIDQDSAGEWGVEVCANPFAWNDARNRTAARLRILRGVHGPFDRATADAFCETVRARISSCK